MMKRAVAAHRAWHRTRLRVPWPRRFEWLRCRRGQLHEEPHRGSHQHLHLVRYSGRRVRGVRVGAEPWR